jgi:hypothetical protein
MSVTKASSAAPLAGHLHSTSLPRARRCGFWCLGCAGLKRRCDRDCNSPLVGLLAVITASLVLRTLPRRFVWQSQSICLAHKWTSNAVWFHKQLLIY